MSFLDNFAQNVAKGGRGRSQVDLPTVLVALSMSDEGVDKETIANTLGMTVHQLNFRIFEKQSSFSKKDKDGNVTGKETKCRSIMKYMYEDHTDPNSKTVDGETFAKNLFEAFGETYEGPEQVDRIIDEWKQKRHGATA